MSWRVRVEFDPFTAGDRIAVGRPCGDAAEVVVWRPDGEDGPVRGSVRQHDAYAIAPDAAWLSLPEGVLDAIVAERRTPGPSEDLVAELRAALAVERARVDRALAAGEVLADAAGVDPEPVDVSTPGQPPSGRLCHHGAPSYVEPPSSCLLPAGHNGSTHGDGVTWWGQS